MRPVKAKVPNINTFTITWRILVYYLSVTRLSTCQLVNYHYQLVYLSTRLLVN